MSDEITPSAVYPAGTPIPTAPPLPAAPYGTPDLPPWRIAAPPPPPPPAAPRPAPAPDPGPIEHHVTVELVYPEQPEPEPEPGRWSRLWDTITGLVNPWKALGALAAAVIPIPWTGYSAAVTWAYMTSEAREMHPAFGYALAAGAFALAVRRFVQRRSLLALWATAVTLFGFVGAADWFDVVVIITGVHR
ncbi:hypothetical protein [Streptomyces turgidiscabies]|uniref:hypothetical protein n=1 Tax=Streptomyces turgidiscabies TaxID=85558 RepID=UPI0038F802C2